MQSVMGMHDPVAINFIVAMNYQKGEFFVQQTSFECLHSIDSGVQQTLGSSLGASTWSGMTWEKLLNFSVLQSPVHKMGVNNGLVRMIK